MLQDFFENSLSKKTSKPLPKVIGRVTRVKGELIEAKGIVASVGDVCVIKLLDQSELEVEVIGFRDDVLALMPLHPVSGLSPGCRIESSQIRRKLPAGNALLGRVVDGLGKPLDNIERVVPTHWLSSDVAEINPLNRKPIDQPLDVGVRAINAACTIGCGQRIGLFAGSGVGKSVLLGMMTRFTTAEIVIVALVGERGREVREFIEQTLAHAKKENYIVVAATADASPLMRLKAGLYAARLAEFFRDEGKRVLLLFDSLTRYAQAQREIALALGEPPATRGYPASVFARIPQLVERAGNGAKAGSITAIYTVLTESDDLQDPIAESARAILDGHLVLSRDLAEEGVYPALDITRSISRVMSSVVSTKHNAAARKLKQLIARYESVKDLLRIGAYQAGEDVETDKAIESYARILLLINQAMDERATFPESLDALLALAGEPLDASALANRVLQSDNGSSAQAPIESVHQAFNEELASHPSITGQ